MGHQPLNRWAVTDLEATTEEPDLNVSLSSCFTVPNEKEHRTQPTSLLAVKALIWLSEENYRVKNRAITSRKTSKKTANR